MSGHGEWNENRTQEDREEDRQEQEADEESGAEKSGGKESRAPAGRPHEKSKQQRRADHLEFQADRPSLARRFRRHGRRHVDPDRARRPPHPLARARKRAEEFHRRRRVRSAQAQGGGADRFAAGPHALEFARDLREHHGGGVPDSEKGAAAGRHGAVRYFGSGETEVDLVLRLL